jgi:hypothetical protein
MTSVGQLPDLIKPEETASPVDDYKHWLSTSFQVYENYFARTNRMARHYERLAMKSVKSLHDLPVYTTRE